MAIDLCCYSSRDKNDVEGIIAEMSAQRHDLFATKFLLSKVRETNATHREIASEYGLAARTIFLVMLNDKNAAASIHDVSEIVKSYLGKENTIVLFNNEKLI